MKLRALAIVEIEVDDVHTKLCSHQCYWLRRSALTGKPDSCTLYERRIQLSEDDKGERLPECRERSSAILNPGG